MPPRTGSPTTGHPRRSTTYGPPRSRRRPTRASSSRSCTASSRSMRPCSLRGSWRSPATCSSAPRPISPICSTRSTRESGKPLRWTRSRRACAGGTRPRTATRLSQSRSRDSPGQPLQGVRVDIAFPNATGGTRARSALHDCERNRHRRCRHRCEPVRRPSGRRGHRQDRCRRQDSVDMVHDQPQAGDGNGRI